VIVIDTSALIAIMGDERERRVFNELIDAESGPCISAANLLETRMVLFARSGDAAALALDAYLLRSGITVVEVSPRVGDIAFDAYRRFGRGTGHPANLNFGDCFSYALAKFLDVPLLFKGDDFAQTDIVPATR